MTRIKGFRRAFVCEQLEQRFVLSNFSAVPAPDPVVPDDADDFRAVIVAGDPKGTPTDSPAKRVDPNTATSPFAGVGSLQISASSGTYICTGTPIDATHVLTAGHCIDIDDNGVPDITGLTFNLNYGGNLTSQITATAWESHPNFSGFGSPSVNDDLAVITLGSALPVGVPTYGLATSDMVAGSTHLYMIGYGQSGDGVKGYFVNSSFTVKRKGENIADAFYGQDDAGQPAAKEVFRFDFDGRRPNTNIFGGGTLGNDRETTLGGGDSGGPSFVLCTGCNPALASSYSLAGVNTFTQGSAPRFGSLGGGINVFPYSAWILGPHGTGGGSGGGAGGASGSARGFAEDSYMIVLPSDGGQTSFAAPVATQSDAGLSTNSNEESSLLANSDQDQAETFTGIPVVIVSSVSAASEFSLDSASGIADDDLVRALDAVLEEGPPIIA